MTAATMTLTEFLLARIAEDEAEIATMVSPGAQYGTPWHWRSRARLDSECEAKRRIVERCHQEVLPPGESISAYDPEAYTDGMAREVLELLAAPYADHPDYRDEWRV